MNTTETITQLMSLRDHCWSMRDSGDEWAKDVEALDKAIAKMRGGAEHDQ